MKRGNKTSSSVLTVQHIKFRHMIFLEKKEEGKETIIAT